MSTVGTSNSTSVGATAAALAGLFATTNHESLAQSTASPTQAAPTTPTGAVILHPNEVQPSPSSTPRDHHLTHEPQFWFYLALAVLLLFLAGAYSGLTVGLLGMDPAQLQVLIAKQESRNLDGPMGGAPEVGDDEVLSKPKASAATASSSGQVVLAAHHGSFLPLSATGPRRLRGLSRRSGLRRNYSTQVSNRMENRLSQYLKNHHRLLSTLLIGNTICLESLPLVWDKILDDESSPFFAILVSIFGVLIFSEIIPMAFLTGDHRLRYITKLEFLLYYSYYYFFALIAVPMAYVLDLSVGKRETDLEEKFGDDARRLTTLTLPTESIGEAISQQKDDTAITPDHGVRSARKTGTTVIEMEEIGVVGAYNDIGEPGGEAQNYSHGTGTTTGVKREPTPGLGRTRSSSTLSQRDLLTLIEMNLPSNEEKLELVRELFLHHHADLSFLRTTSSKYSPHKVDENYLERGRSSTTAVELQPREIEHRQSSSSSSGNAGGERTRRIRSTSSSTSSTPGRTMSNYHGARTTTTSGAPLGHQQASSTTLRGDASQQAVVPTSPAQFPTGVEVVPATLTGAPQLSPSRTGFGERRQIGVEHASLIGNRYH
ncbi:unnamed protein product [Amoebophrya sp. A120]|nr:unnamed protein product [Amoebophrya sp. A120]|eukprot:GSA120T00014445001.1